jgi:hypothetical protein
MATRAVTIVLMIATCSVHCTVHTIPAEDAAAVSSTSGAGVHAPSKPSTCRKAFVSQLSSNFTDRGYIPFLGTSVTSDRQLLLLRLLHSIDYPVKHLIVVAQDPKMHKGSLIKAEIEHAQQFVRNIVLIYCDTQPAVTEAWNAVFQAFPHEPWGMYAARDVQFKPGALETFSKHVWQDMEDGSLDMAFINW